FSRRQLVRRAVASTLFDEDQRTIIQDDMFFEKALGISEARREQAPEPASADFGAVTFETGDGPPWMLAKRTAHQASNSEPVANGGHFAEGHARLGHAERARVHAQEDDSFWPLPETAQIIGMWFPRV